MIKGIVVDDEKLTAEHICRLLKKSGVEVVGCFHNPFEVLEKIDTLKPDVLFLDIEMPGISGLDLAEKVHAKGYEGEIVFITAYNQYAIEAFGVNALDYLLKPVTPQDVDRAVERVKKRRMVNSKEGLIKNDNQLRVSLFGSVALFIEGRGESIRWMTSKCAEIFAYMILQKGEKEISKWKIIESIWPDKDVEKADINLRSSISRLNKTLRENSIGISMVSTGSGYVLNMKDVNLKVDAFELEDLTIQSKDICSQNEEYLNKVILSCKDMFLEEFSGEWCHVLRVKYNRYLIGAAKKLIGYYERIKAEPIKILDILDLMVKHEPYDEEIRELALRLYYKISGKAGAEKYYKQYRELLKKDLDIEPDRKINNLYKSIMNGDLQL